MLNAYLADATCEDFKKIRSKVKRSWTIPSGTPLDYVSGLFGVLFFYVISHLLATEKYGIKKIVYKQKHLTVYYDENN